MSNTVNRYAVLATGSNKVENIILASEDFTQDGYTLNLINSGVFCDIGMFYNESDGLYYQDEAFTTIYPVVEYEAGTTVVAASDTSASADSSSAA